MWKTGVRSSPYAHVITTDQFLWISDGGTNRIVKYDLNGHYLYGWGGPGGQTSERGAESATPHARAILDERGRVMVFITHNMDEAIFFSDRILVMGTRPGRIIEEVRVELPRPREADAVRASREFASLREHLWSLLSQGAKSQGVVAS